MIRGSTDSIWRNPLRNPAEPRDLSFSCQTSDCGGGTPRGLPPRVRALQSRMFF